VKDRLENFLRGAVCSGRMSLRAAQIGIARDLVCDVGEAGPVVVDFALCGRVVRLMNDCRGAMGLRGVLTFVHLMSEGCMR
jgi:hypothetical protein